MEGFLRRRDLPSFCRVKELADHTLQLIISETQATTRSSGLILNTVEPLESEILSHIRSVIPNVYPIGPIHAFLNKSRRSSMSSLLTEDRTCMAWLDVQPPKSVVYVSFGSIATVTRDQLLEFWHGLVNSEMRFLWVLRDNLVVNADGEQETCVPSVAAYEKGRIVSWVPQLEVLGHPAIGGFLTHSGWNSTLESITVGVPMVCWPYFADQQINSRFVSDVWRVGLDMKDTCDRVKVEKMVRELMEEGERSVGMRRLASEFAEKVKSSIDEGGSSYGELQRLIHDIRSTGTAGEVF
ncbi:UDP-glycosyltransferase 85A5 [Acorus calamus]|uniref:UDP-glycosyltransferase 85A5 n=1 Tax=Acorus calamus TaxID=4465 RepID=A0AAV9D6S5_ACOCL|nr:UDP-glycosyltransferase 85A5 [Acorus calamus]